MPKKPGRKPKHTKAGIMRAVRGCGGIYTNLAARLSVTRETAVKYIREDEDLRLAFQQEREAMIDRAENKLADQIDSGEQWAVKFILATLGKNRGYTERHEVTGADGEPVDLTVTFVEPGQ